MGGGLMQLVAYGAQDVYLTGNPQITFFKVVYRRHTNFAMESIEQVFNGTADFGRKSQCPVVRNGDLITKTYLRVQLNAGVAASKWAWCTSLGHALIDNVELEIGGTRIDKHWGDWLTIWNELSRKIGQDAGYARMIGNVPELTSLNFSHPAYNLWIPMKFFFCRFDGLALPLIALQYHEVRMNFEFVKLMDLISYEGASAPVFSSTPSMAECSLYIDYIYLDSEERKRFAQASHEYLIEALQFPGAESVTQQLGKYRLNLNHPCKFLIWCNKLNRYSNGSKFLCYNPNDINASRVRATICDALRNADVDSFGVLVDNYGNVKASSANAEYEKVLRYTKVVAISFDGNSLRADCDEDNFTVLGELLPIDYISYPVGTFKGTMTFDNGEQVTIDTTGLTPSMCAPEHEVTVHQYDNFGLQIDGSENAVQKALLQLNGQDRFSEREGDYFNYVQPWQSFSNTPADGINVYSFALNPEEHQPSGTCNFSRIDNATLNVNIGRKNPRDGSSENGFAANYLKDGASFSVYAVNYNVLRVMSGMAGLAYSN